MTHQPRIENFTEFVISQKNIPSINAPLSGNFKGYFTLTFKVLRVTSLLTAIPL